MAIKMGDRLTDKMAHWILDRKEDRMTKTWQIDGHNKSENDIRMTDKKIIGQIGICTYILYKYNLIDRQKERTTWGWLKTNKRTSKYSIHIEY